MGPPKKRIPKTRYSELLRRNNYFEYRWNDKHDSYYLFNPHTGETIIQSSYDVLDRCKSMWSRPDDYISKTAQSVMLYRDTYQSRYWGLREFHGWRSRNDAAGHIQTVWWGYKARRDLARYFGQRYIMSYCNLAHYLYFFDLYGRDQESASSWHKPLLAMPWDIGERKEPDPEEHLGEDKYSYRPFEKGPLIIKQGLSKAATGRAKMTAFAKANPLRDRAISLPSEIDLEATPLGSIIAFFDGSKAVEIYIDECVQMNTAISGNNWHAVLDLMDKYPDNPINQIFGLRKLAGSFCPLMDDALNTQVLEDVAVRALYKCIDWVRLGHLNRPNRSSMRIGYVHLIFTLQLLTNLINTPCGRREFFSTDTVTEQGEARDKAIAKLVAGRINIFNPFLTNNHLEFNPLENQSFPSRRCSELAEEALKCLCYMAHEIDYREKMAEELPKKVLRCLQIHENVPAVVREGCRFLYNLCYRAEGGQELVLKAGARRMLMAAARDMSGEPDVMAQVRRLQLAIKEGGYRGYVEDLIEMEMNGEAIDPSYLQDIGKVHVSDDEEEEGSEAQPKPSNMGVVAMAKVPVKEDKGGYKDDNDSVASELTHDFY